MVGQQIKQAIVVASAIALFFVAVALVAGLVMFVVVIAPGGGL